MYAHLAGILEKWKVEKDFHSSMSTSPEKCPQIRSG